MNNLRIVAWLLLLSGLLMNNMGYYYTAIVLNLGALPLFVVGLIRTLKKESK